MHRWLVGGALIEGPEGLLLVRNRRRGGREDWSTPGGVIDEGETLIEGLGREVLEETGLVVTAWSGPVYEVQAEAPDLGWTLRVEVHRAVEYHGELALDDPDEIVIDARFLADEDCTRCLGDGHRWVAEPLGEWLAERWAEQRTYGYVLRGRGPFEVERLA